MGVSQSAPVHYHCKGADTNEHQRSGGRQVVEKSRIPQRANGLMELDVGRFGSEQRLKLAGCHVCKDGVHCQCHYRSSARLLLSDCGSGREDCGGHEKQQASDPDAEERHQAEQYEGNGENELDC